MEIKRAVWDVTPTLLVLVGRHVLYNAKGEGTFNHLSARVKKQLDNYSRTARCWFYVMVRYIGIYVAAIATSSCCK